MKTKPAAELSERETETLLALAARAGVKLQRPPRPTPHQWGYEFHAAGNRVYLEVSRTRKPGPVCDLTPEEADKLVGLAERAVGREMIRPTYNRTDEWGTEFLALGFPDYVAAVRPPTR